MLNILLNNRARFFIGATIALLLFGYWTSFYSLHSEWVENGPFSHGYLAFLVAAYLVITNPPSISKFQKVPEKILAMLALLGSVAIWLVGELGSILLFELFGVFAIFVSLGLVFFGFSAMIQSWVPILVVFFALPIWNFLQIPLRIVSTEVAVIVLRLLEVPFVREEFLITLVSGQFVVAAACSGLGFFLSSLSFSILFGEVMSLNWVKRILFVLLGVAVALVSNWIRVVVIIYVGHKTEMNHPWVADHGSFGWVLFSVMLMLLYFAGYKLFCQSGSQEIGPEGRGLSGFEWSQLNLDKVTLYSMLVLGIPILITKNLETSDQSQQLIQNFDASFKDEKAIPSYIDWAPVFVGADREQLSLADYKKTEYYRYNGLYAEQDQGKEVIFVKNKLFEDTRWQTIDQYATEDGAQILVQQRFGSGKKLRLLAYTYWVGGEFTGRPIKAKLLEIYAKLMGDPSALVLAVMLPVDKHVVNASDIAIEKKILEDLMSHEMGRLHQIKVGQLPQVVDYL